MRRVRLRIVGGVSTLQKMKPVPEAKTKKLAQMEALPRPEPSEVAREAKEESKVVAELDEDGGVALQTPWVEPDNIIDLPE